MSDRLSTLHLLCGKIAAGKSSLAAELAREPNTVLISEDDWLAALFADQLETPRDYVRCAALLRKAMVPHVIGLLNARVSVVLDFPANTLETRTWMREILDGTQVEHQMHVLETPDALCLERLHARNAAEDHPFSATEAQFQAFSRHFVPPQPDEGFNILVHKTKGP